MDLFLRDSAAKYFYEFRFGVSDVFAFRVTPPHPSASIASGLGRISRRSQGTAPPGRPAGAGGPRFRDDDDHRLSHARLARRGILGGGGPGAQLGLAGALHGHWNLGGGRPDRGASAWRALPAPGAAVGAPGFLGRARAHPADHGLAVVEREFPHRLWPIASARCHGGRLCSGLFPRHPGEPRCRRLVGAFRRPRKAHARQWWCAFSPCRSTPAWTT